MTPLRTPESARKYQLTYLPVGADSADGAAADGAVGETEIIVNAMWLEQTALQVQVVGDGEATAKVTMARRPGAQLTKDVSRLVRLFVRRQRHSDRGRVAGRAAQGP